MKILIAEDDLTSRTMLKAMLAKWGYEVISTPDGRTAYAEFQSVDAPPMALLDWEMPGMDGLTLCRRLREQQKTASVYVILLTSRKERRDIIQGLNSGADDYISKPYDSEELLARVNIGCRMIKMQDELREQGKLLGVLEMAGAVCHELNQPLQSVSGFSELLLMGIGEDDAKYDILCKIKTGIDRLAELTGKIMRITRYLSKPYLGGARIVDIEGASRNEKGEES